MLQRKTVALLCALLPGITVAADNSGYDAVLDGFEEPAPAESEAGLDAVLEGFGGEALSADEPRQEPGITDAPWFPKGAVTLSSTYNYEHDAPATGAADYRGVSRLRGKLNLEWEHDLGSNWQGFLSGYTYYDAIYALNGRDDYTEETLDEMESEAELGETYLRGRFGKVDLTLGRQVIVWGKSDNLRVTDVINPLDNREPGMVDIEDLRLPLTMARLDYYVGDWGLTALAIPEIRFHKMPPYGYDFYPMPGPMPTEQVPNDGGGSTEYAFAASGIFSGWDLSLHWAQLYDDGFYRTVESGTPVLKHARLTMSGVAATAAVESWLLKGEWAHLDGLRFSGVADSYSRDDILLGLEYAGFNDTTLALEIVQRRIGDFDTALKNIGEEESEWQSALRYQGDFMHARLHLLALVSRYGEQWDEGGFSRISAAYDLQDALTVTAGVVTYQGGAQFPFQAIADNDRLFAELKFSF